MTARTPQPGAGQLGSTGTAPSLGITHLPGDCDEPKLDQVFDLWVGAGIRPTGGNQSPIQRWDGWASHTESNTAHGNELRSGCKLS